MSDLITAARKQLEYAGKEFKSGDKKKGQEHLDKADAFLVRAAKEDATQSFTETADLPSADPSADPYYRPEGGYSRAATLDASAIANKNAGGNPTPEFDQYDGQAQKEGYTGVIGASGAGELKVYSVFKDGAVVAIVNGDGNTDTSALAEQYGIPA